MINRVLITGSRGMVGRNLVDNFPKSWIISAPSRKELDLLSFPETRRFLADFRPDTVVHAAGRVGGIQANIASPVEFLVENVDIGRNIVVASHEIGVRRVLNLSSSCIYPSDREGMLSEEDILTGPLELTNEGYAIAKIFALRLGEYINRQYKKDSFKTLVPCNIYGRYDHFEENVSHLVPSVIRKIHYAKELNLDTVEIWGDGTARREFMYAGDLAKAITRALTHFDTLPGTMNIGIGKDYSVLQYYLAVSKVVGWSGRFIFNLEKPVGMRRKLVDVTKQQVWGWEPETSLHDGITATYSYFKEII